MRKYILNMFFIMIILSLTTTKISKANANENKCTENYIISESEEKEFYKSIYEKETDSTKIGNIEKTELSKNYITKEVSETKILNTQDKEDIYKAFGDTKEYNDGDYKGILQITKININVIDNGYHEKLVEKSIPFTNYSNNDLNNIEKELTIDNQKYYLINVNWEPETTQVIDSNEIPATYKGEKIYQSIKKVKNENTYNVEVIYSGTIEKINKVYEYKVIFENNEKTKEIPEENKKTNDNPIPIISSAGLVAVIFLLVNTKNTYIYSKTDKGFKLIKMAKLSDKNVTVNISNCKNKSNNGVYAIKINNLALKKLKGRTISLILGNRKKDIVIWNNYYEIKI